MMNLNGKVAVITGASSGIGAGIAQAFAQQQMNVVLGGRNEQRLKEVASSIQEDTQVQVRTFVVDVTKNDEVNNLVNFAQEQFGKIDVLVNSAGQMLSSAVTDGDVDAWDTMLDVNVKGMLYGINAVLPKFLAQSSGHIINIASISGFEVTKQSTLYSMTKTAVHTLTQGLEKELAKTGVRATSISPGMVETSMTESTDWGGRKKLEPKDIAEAAIYALQQPAHVNVNEVTVRPV
ncbi:SDR family oxidoreductase [Staphylococcus kloosii]|uniref:SDR family oxidoreductase n=2 Tax=Staphylococcus kloosii TaxID=29384 RepID=A0A921H1N1_9STAP|nr:SDR family oxidoreductase [Staphylococcus kloosii]AVQ35316.1 SDR family NAD(P)-dependent oxidoreductase [Staphylococcus kloosii]MBF7021252.1 SDR family oxidoreductase [Staphylococcus kloosii]MBF7024892.1 SDR family oxidoreductase [Staphylococcus kloosii]MBF7030529.1 SDR family oxidoreductase [Staphylococcus kloosii]PNZ07369.1 oxidoreductase [Staphylococcus kloosii]